MGIQGDQVGVGGSVAVEGERRGGWQRRQGAVKSSSCGRLWSAPWTRLCCLKNAVSNSTLPFPPGTRCRPLSSVGAHKGSGSELLFSKLW